MNALKRSGGSARAVQDIAGGFLLVAIAALALYLVNHLPATGRVGFASGTAPRLFAYGLGGLGLWIAITGFFKEGPGIDGFNWRGLVTIIGSVLFFAFSIRIFGLAVTGVPMVVLASFAARDGRIVESVIFGGAITLFCCLLFPGALGQPIPLWPQF
jgi:putative tricarboxylic transport membrane protein